MKYEQWDTETTKLQNLYGYKGKSPGRLANVSTYEFINDWVRPEIAWKIFSYVAEDPHKKGVNKSQQIRRKFHSRKNYIIRPSLPAKWIDEDVVEESDIFRQRPYCELGLWRRIDSPNTETIDEFVNDWVRHQDIQQIGNEVMRLKYVNPLLMELWSFHHFHYNTNGNKTFTITKKQISEYLKLNNVKGRTNLTYGVKCSNEYDDGTYNSWWVRVADINNPNQPLMLPPPSRREMVGALMKI